MQSGFCRLRACLVGPLALIAVLLAACGGSPVPKPTPDGQSGDSTADVQHTDTTAECSGDGCEAAQVDQVTAGPACLAAKPELVDFGGNLPGNEPKVQAVNVCNCGGVALQVTAAELVSGQGNPAVFSVDQQKLFKQNKIQAPAPITADNPLPLEVGACVALDLAYAPTALTQPGAAPDSALLRFTSDLLAPIGVKLRGKGVDELCPTPKIKVLEGEETVPQTLLHLDGSGSDVGGGTQITKYQWTVKQPQNSFQPLVPNDSAANPTFQANASGEYLFCLDVWNDSGLKSCSSYCIYVLVIPNSTFHVELLWDTPTDPDQTDTGPAAGADLDLHFGHPMSVNADLDCDGVGDPWFNNPFDCFWFNNAPEWGSMDPAIKDNPFIEYDATGGPGPENLHLIQPEGDPANPAGYSVGVHYWHDHGFGPSFATVSIWTDGALVAQFSKVKLQPRDMWYVGKLWWPNVASGGTKKVFQACYQSGQSCPAKQNLMWQPKGDWCITPCYPVKPELTWDDKLPGPCSP